MPSIASLQRIVPTGIFKTFLQFVVAVVILQRFGLGRKTVTVVLSADFQQDLDKALNPVNNQGKASGCRRIRPMPNTQVFIHGNESHTML